MYRRTLHVLALCVIVAVSLLTTATTRGFIIDPEATPWFSTASGNRTANGQPATLTWGFVPDGTIIYDGIYSLGESDLIAKLNDAFGGDIDETNPQSQPWFTYFEDSFNRWSELSGLTYVYESNDSGEALSTTAGELGVRADIRIGGVSIDGSSGTLAFNYFPDIGDMAIDTDDADFFANPVKNYLQLRNTIMHESGHGLGFDHVVSDTDALLMEPVLDLSFDGPQLDDVRAVHYYYGDVYEKSNGGLGNNQASLATPLGTIMEGQTASIGADADIPNQAVGPDDVDFVSLSNASDIDYFSFTITQTSIVNLLLTPLGGQFTQAAEGITPNTFDASARADLLLQLWDSDGKTLLEVADLTSAGDSESIVGFELPKAGQYFASISTIDDTVQLYRLDITVQTSAQIPGDLNGDGFVGLIDLDIFLVAWNQHVEPGNLMQGDPSGDGFVGLDDLDIVLSNWNKGTPPNDSAVLIPEPTITSFALALSVLGIRLRPCA